MLSGMTTPPLDVNPYVRDLSATLMTRSAELGAELAELIRATDIRYRDENVVPRTELVRSCQDNLELLFATLAGLPAPHTSGPQETGRRRAEQGIPLEMTLRGFRIGGRFIWNVLVRSADHSAASREALLQAAEVIWAMIDDYSEILISAVRDTLAEQARRDTQLRTAVLDTVLDGSLGDGPALWEAATMIGLPHLGTFIVVVAEARQSGDEPLPRVEQSLRARDVRSAWRMDTQRQIGVLALRRESAIAAVCQQLARLATARIGVSQMFPGLESAPRALGEARVACLAAAPNSRQLIRYEQDPVAILLASAPDASKVFAHAVLQPVLAQPAADRAVLLETLRSWFAENGSTSAAAAELHVHRNTVRYRLRRIEEITGQDLADPGAAARLLLALEACAIFDLANESG
jgi:PucR C-terminal helix-turn-helix domain/GGDEF-like domain